MAMLAKVMRYLQATGMPATVFGRAVANDPRLVGDMLNGRDPRPTTCARIDAFIAAHPDAYRPRHPTRRRSSNAR